MEFSAQQLADLLKGQVEGNPDVVVNKLSKIEEGKKNSISFLANEQYTEYLYTTDASVVIVNKTFEVSKPVKDTCTLIRVDDPRRGFAKLLEKYNEVKHQKNGVEGDSMISKKATIGKDVYVGSHTYVGDHTTIGDHVKIYPNCSIGDNVTIGGNTIIYSNVTVNANCIIGANCTLQPGAVIGSDGFGFIPNSENNYEKVAQTGNVILEDQVDVGANTTIDRATLGSTIIRKGVKLDNLIQVAHNVEIGENTVIAAQTGIAGSTKIGKNCMIGGQVGIVGHIQIADNVKIAAQSGIGHNIEKEGEVEQGSPSFSIRDYKRSYVLFRNLPEIQDKIDKLEKLINKDE